MPIAEQNTMNTYTGNGVATTYAYTFKVFANTDLKVTVGGVLKTLTTDYTVTGVGADGGGNVVFVTPPANLAVVTIYREMPYSRTTDYTENGDFKAQTIDDDLDKQTMLTQQMRRDIKRAIKLPVEESTDHGVTDTPSSRANKVVAFDAAGALKLKSATEIGTATVIDKGLVINAGTLAAKLGNGLQFDGSDAISVINPVLHAVAEGTANAMTAAVGVVLGALTNNLRIWVEAIGGNTVTAPTFNLNALGAKPIVRRGGEALVPGDIPGANYRLDLVFDSSLDSWILLNPDVYGMLYRQGRDIREFLPFGYVVDGSVDYTAQIENALSTMAAAGGGKLIIPEGSFGATKIVRRHLVSIAGIHQRKSKLIALPSAEMSFLQIATGPVLYSHLENLTIWGGNGVVNNAGQWGFFSESVAQVAPPNNGGEWYSNHKNLEFRYFDNGMWYKAGATGFLLPNQFITHENVTVVRAADTGIALKLSGQVGQFLDLNGQYDGKTIGLGTNIYIGRDGGTNAPYTCNFIGVTTQVAERGFDIDYAWNINIKGGNFESLYRAIRTAAASAMVNITGNKFANAGSDGASGGYILQIGSTCAGNFEGNYIYGSFDKVVSNDTAQRGFRVGGNNFGGITDLVSTKTSGMTIQKSVTAGPPVSLDLYALRDVLVNTSASTITQINSFLMPGELLFLKAYTGPITLGTGGNITLGGAATVTVPQNAHAVLKRADLAGTWELVTVSRTTAVAKLAPGTTASAAYVQAELQATMDKVDAVIDALRTTGLMK